MSWLHTGIHDPGGPSTAGSGNCQIASRDSSTTRLVRYACDREVRAACSAVSAVEYRITAP